MARTKMVCTEPSMAEKLVAKMSGKKAKQKCTREKVNKDKANSIASQINWANKSS